MLMRLIAVVLALTLPVELGSAVAWRCGVNHTPSQNVEMVPSVSCDVAGCNCLDQLACCEILPSALPLQIFDIALYDWRHAETFDLAQALSGVLPEPPLDPPRPVIAESSAV